MAEQQVELIRELNRAFEHMSIPALSTALHSDCVHVTLPQSVNIPKRNKAQTVEYYEKMFSNWTAVEALVTTFIANTPGKVATRIACDVVLKSGSTVSYESCTVFEIDEDSSGNKKIKRLEEFIDANAQAQGFDPFIAAEA